MHSNDDLTWYYLHAAAALGACSNFEATRMAIMSGGVSKTSKSDSLFTESRMSAAERYRLIRAKLDKIPQYHRDVLYAAHVQRQWPQALIHAFTKEVLPLAIFTKSANDYYDADGADGDRMFWTWLEGCGEERTAIIKAEAAAMLRKAIRAYERV